MTTPKSPKGTSRKPENVLPMSKSSMESILSQITGVAASGSALNRAQEIMYEASEEPNPAARVKLARKALEISSDCADAYVMLAEHIPTNLEEALKLYQQGVEAGVRAIGKERFEEYRGHFWGVLETRPYMRAKAGVASCLWELGRRIEALDHYGEMLDLNPNDNQGIRDVLLSSLLEMKLDDLAAKLLRAYSEDPTAQWAYSKALLAFRHDGDSAKSQKLLAAAINCNPFVPAYLLGTKKIPRRLPDVVGFGDESEAIGYAGDNVSGWRDTHGALGWLREFVKAAGKV